MRAALRGWRQPKRRRGRIPDIEGINLWRREPARILAEIEEAHTLFVPHAQEQLEAFAVLASQKMAICYLVVPKRALPLAKLMLGQLGLRRTIKLAWVSPWQGGCHE